MGNQAVALAKAVQYSSAGGFDVVEIQPEYPDMCNNNLTYTRISWHVQ